MKIRDNKIENHCGFNDKRMNQAFAITRYLEDF